MSEILTRRQAVRSAASVLAAALVAACGRGPARTEKQQMHDLQATVAALQAQLSRTAPATNAIATPVATSVAPAAGSSGVLAPPAGTARSLLAAPLPPKPGETVPITLESGERLEVAINNLIDPAVSTHPFNKAKGRWVVVDWTIANRGSIGHRVNIFACLLQTADGFMLKVGNSAGLPQPELISGLLGPGQSVRGFVPYDVASGARLKSVIYQPLGNRQFVVADLES